MVRKTALAAAVLIFFSGCASMQETSANKRDIIVRYAKNMTDKKYSYGAQDDFVWF